MRAQIILALSLCVLGSFAATDQPPRPRDLNTPRTFPEIASRQAWNERASWVRDQVLISCGLWPMPEKTPLRARAFGKIERDGYTVEKVCFESLPGFWVGGNLYRPSGKGKGPFPGVLNPHGHWKEGRLADAADGSIPARCISFARQGMVAFSYDMVGFNDTRFGDAPANRPYYEQHRLFGTNRTDLLWNISLMGLQTWDSIRALDFLASLPDVDPRRLACTGESGGGTQTYILGAIDSRLAAQVPVVMVSHTMQGGCSCENSPGLRVEFSNMEVSAAAAPRPQLLVAATGDWTRDTPRVEGPSIAHIYELLGARQQFDYVQFDFGHNYNRTSREAVYKWLGPRLLKNAKAVSFAEQPCQKEPAADLLVFPDKKVPSGTLTRDQMTAFWKDTHRAQWQALLPRSKAGLEKFNKQMLPAWKHTLQLGPGATSSPARMETAGGPEPGLKRVSFAIGEHGEAVLARYWAPRAAKSQNSSWLVVVCPAESASSAADTATLPEGMARRLSEQGFAVLVIDQYSSKPFPDEFSNFFTTYNRTELQERVRDLVAVCTAARTLDGGHKQPFNILLAGRGRAGAWCLLAAPSADATVADCNQLDAGDEHALLSPGLFCPGLLTIGGFAGAAMLSAPRPLLLHNTGTAFRTDAITQAYSAASKPDRFRANRELLSDDSLAAAIGDLVRRRS